MKKVLYIIICISICTVTFSQTKQQKKVLADPTTWDGFDEGSPKAGQSFPKKIAMGETEGVMYIFSSPVTESVRSGSPKIHPRIGTRISGYIIKGGEVVSINAKIVSGPKVSGAWQAMFNNGVDAVEVVTKEWRTYKFFEPRIATCYEVGWVDENGVKHHDYEVEFAARATQITTN